MNLCFPYIIKDHYLLKESVVRMIVKRTDVSFYCCHRSCLEGTGSSSEASFLTVTNNALGCCWNAWKSWRGCTYVWSEVFILYQSCSRNCLFEELELGVCERFFSSCLILSRIIAGAIGCLSWSSCAAVLIWKVFILGKSCCCGTGALNLKGIFSCIFMACILFILLLRKLLKNWIFDARIEKCAFVEDWLC